jgi:hypothetical protein
MLTRAHFLLSIIFVHIFHFCQYLRKGLARLLVFL